ncbi:hypothetical protein [Variovorax ginsengisoli]|uniref:Uncharacterized protein n=1 Tax=Variovorax ginsengisoli TaxID=363844 RepID=A0ABT9S1W7_9BURK|nr:hypothetical protein [Variovorax ginsengisoli]MDP9898350.1 hypothetical protein [Variovorax ginsengisoli]
MRISKASAKMLVHAYLDGRSMDAFMFDAVVWMAQERLTHAQVPTLDQRLRDDIDSQASGVRGIRTEPCTAAPFNVPNSDAARPSGLHPSP